MKKILITGAAGFIASNLVNNLNKKYEIHILTRKESNLWRIKKSLPNINNHTVDLADFNLLNETIKKINPEYIFHLATYGGYPDRQNDFDDLFKNNSLATFNLLKSLKNINYELFVNTGTSSEYGIRDDAMKEDDVLKPVNVYGALKAGSTLLCQTIARLKNKPIVTFRISSAYGPYEDQNRLISSTIISCLQNKTLELTEGTQCRDFVFTEDIVKAYEISMSKSNKLIGEIINISSNIQTPIRKVVELIKEKTNSKSSLLFGAKPSRPNEVKNWIVNSEKAESLLGWKAEHDLTKGIEKTANWFKENLELYS